MHFVQAEIVDQFTNFLYHDPETNIFDFLLKQPIKITLKSSNTQVTDLDLLVFMMALSKQMHIESKPQRDLFSILPKEASKLMFKNLWKSVDQKDRFATSVDLKEKSEEISLIDKAVEQETINELSLSTMFYEILLKIKILFWKMSIRPN